MRLTLKQIAEKIGASVEGDANLVITGAGGIKTAGPGDVTFAAGKFEAFVAKTAASAVVVREDFTAKGAHPALLRTKAPDKAFEKIAYLFAPEPQRFEPGVHPAAVVSPRASVDKTAHVGALSVIEEGASVGAGTIIYPLVYIGRAVSVGKDCRFYPGACVLERCKIGDRVILHSGVVVGSDGFGFDKKNGLLQKIPQLGWVEIEDDVELGANTAVDRARFGKTIIKKNSKLDNLVHIAHNVSVGRNTAISALSGISGSNDIGDNVTIAGQVGTADHVTIGDNAILSGRAGITKDVEPGEIVSGFPHLPHEEFKRLFALQRKLPKLFETVKQLEKRLAQLDGTAKNNKKRD